MIYKHLITSIIALSLFAILITSCGERQQYLTGSLSGYIVLEGDDVVDNSGIVVELYKAVSLDTTITRVNLDYPHIGVHISQETEFDHRLSNPIKSGVTNPNGSFEFKGVPVGKYNLFAYKDNWGFLYEYDVSIIEGENIASSINEPLIMYPDIFLSSNIFDVMVFESGRHYVMEEDTNFHSGSQIIINPVTVIRINPGKIVTIQGNLTVLDEPGKYFRVTSNDGFYSQNNDLTPYERVLIGQNAKVTDNRISGGIFHFGRTSLMIQEQGITITNSILSGEMSACVFMAAENIKVSYSIIRGTTIQDQSALKFESILQGIVEKCIFIDNSIGLEILTSTNITVENSYFYDNDFITIANYYSSEAQVVNNIFGNSSNAVFNGIGSTINVQRNIFYSAVGVQNGFIFGQIGASYPTINYNNFYCSEYAVSTRAFYNGQIRYLDATNNYWGTTNPAEIEDLIWDRSDEDPSHIDYNHLLAYFLYEPFLNRRFSGAGIQLNGD